MALAGGVNLVLSPEVTVALSRAHMMSPDGYSKTFDARANGFVRGEGSGVVVLKRLRDAERDGDRIQALIRGSAVNQDGRSSGLTAPNGLAQEALLRQALSAARLSAGDIDYIEAHGTGTSLGDPIEARALASVLGRGRGENPLKVRMQLQVKTMTIRSSYCALQAASFPARPVARLVPGQSRLE